MFDASEMIARIHARVDDIEQGAHKGLTAAAEDILGEAVKLVPIEEGTLQDSGTTKVDGLTAGIGFGLGAAAPYAVPQHEEMGYSHDAGRTPHYLSKPMMAGKDQVLKTVARFTR